MGLQAAGRQRLQYVPDHIPGETTVVEKKKTVMLYLNKFLL